MSEQFVSSNNYVTMRKWDRVDLLCPHPFLRERSSSKTTSVGQEEEPRGGLLTTTAFRSPKSYAQPPPPQPRTLVVTLLRLWQQVGPQDIRRYAVALRPIVCQIFSMYLRNELELSGDELVRMRELGRTLVDYCRTVEYARTITSTHNGSRATDGVSDWLRGQHISIGTHVASGGANPRRGLVRAATVPVTLAERSGYSFHETVIYIFVARQPLRNNTLIERGHTLSSASFHARILEAPHV
ncbi:hypothetical protein OPQ81_010447 [Rhizoctonia solani]|nr:hypothetical protein OPQ81_010447 [Rhizoctonia solani]